MPCVYSESLGVAGRGFHSARVPGTDTAAGDFFGTVLLAWGLSAATGVRCSLWAIVLFGMAEALHSLFCVRVGTRG